MPNCCKQTVGRRGVQLIDTDQFYESKNGVNITVRKLGRNNANLLTSRKIFRKYQPIELRIENRGDSAYLLEAKNIELELVELKSVIKSVRANLAKAFFFPGAYITPKKYYANVLIAIATLPARIFNPIYGIGTIVAALMTNVALTGQDNQKLGKRFKKNSKDLSLGILIAPRKQITTTIFVLQENFKQEFNLTLLNSESSEKLTFKVDL